MTQGFAQIVVDGLVHEREYVQSFPVCVAFDLRASPAGWVVHLPPNDWLLSTVNLGIDVYALDGTKVLESAPRGGVDEHHGPPRMTVRDTPTRVMVDLESRVRDLDPGSYTARIAAFSGRGPAWSDSFAFVLRAPSDDEREFAAQRPQDVSHWVDWALRNTIPVPPASDAGLQSTDPLRFARFLRAVVWNDAELDVLSRDHIDALDGVFSHEREAVWAEALLARGATQEANAQCAHILAGWPGMRPRVEEILAGHGRYAGLRTSLRGTT